MIYVCTCFEHYITYIKLSFLLSHLFVLETQYKKTLHGSVHPYNFQKTYKKTSIFQLIGNTFTDGVTLYSRLGAPFRGNVCHLCTYFRSTYIFEQLCQQLLETHANESNCSSFLLWRRVRRKQREKIGISFIY